MSHAPWRLAATCVLSALLATPAGATPCEGEDLPPAVAQLGERLSAARTPLARRSFARAAAQTASTHKGVASACAHYQAAAAHFFLSQAKATQRMHAAFAVKHLLAANLLAPTSMTGVQATSRLKTAWARVGKVPGWLTGAPVQVQLSKAAGTLRLSPADPEAWQKVCGDDPACVPATSFVLPLATGGTLRMRPGAWRAEYVTDCGSRARPFTLAAGELSLPPAPACPLKVTVVDGGAHIPGVEVLGPGGVVLTLEGITSDHGAVTLGAPGYHPKGLSLTKPGPYTVTLERCPVDLKVVPRPLDADVTGSGLGPWGKRRVRVVRAGYVAYERDVAVPRPRNCSGAPHELKVGLSRHVTIVARAPDGSAVMASRVAIEGEEVALTGFARQPGHYAWEAAHPQHGAAAGNFEVPHCVAGEQCRPAQLEVRFGRGKGGEAAGGRSGAKVVMGLGGLSLGAGLIAGTVALGKQQEINSYTTRIEEEVSIDTLVDERESAAKTANILAGTGVLLIISGFVWYAAGGE